MKNLLTFLSFLGLLVCVASSWAHGDENKRQEEKQEKKYEFTTETIKAQPVMTVRFKVPAESAKISAKYGEVFTAIFTHVLSNGGQVAGQPFGRYHAVKDTELDIEAGIPVAKSIEGKGEIKATELPRVLFALPFVQLPLDQVDVQA